MQRNRQISDDDDIKQACRYGSECRDQSDPSHYSRYSHPTPKVSSSSWNSTISDDDDMKQACRYGNECRDQSDPTHCKRYSHPTPKVSSSSWNRSNRSNIHTTGVGDDIKQACRYGNECRDQSDPSHCSRYSHPTPKVSSSLWNSSNRSNIHTIGKDDDDDDIKQACRYGSGCRDQSDPTHCKRYSHPTSKEIPSSWNRSNRSNIHTVSKDDDDIKQVCRYGNECPDQSDPSHCSRYSHPASTLPFSLQKKMTTSRSHRCGGDSDGMEQAYRIGGALALEKLSQADQTAIKSMRDDAIIIIPGTYDHIDRVLDNLNIKYIIVEQNKVATYPFRNDQTVYINCVATFPIEGARRLRQEVEKGLHIITTDWALNSVLQVAFSDFVKYNGQATADEVVGIQVVDPNHPLVNGFLSASKHAEPQWWLETSSYPIEIVNKSQVRVLIRSESLGQRYKSDAVLVTFDCKKGNVIHMISHFYLQRSETRGDRHKMSAKQFAIDSKASAATTNLVANQGQNLNYAQIQSSSTSAQFIYNQISTRLKSTK